MAKALMTPADALKLLKKLGADTANIVIIPRSHAAKRQRERSVTRRQIELCVQKGTVQEGPFMNAKGHWQFTLFRHAAGEELTCVVVIEPPTSLVIITVYNRRSR